MLQFGEWLRDDLRRGVFEPPVFDPDLAILLTQARQAEKLWIEKASGYSGKAAINAFARAAREAGLADLTRW